MRAGKGASVQKSAMKRARQPEPSPSPSPELETDDEVDEFAEDYQSEDGDDSGEEGEEEEEDDEDEEGVTRYEPDELEGFEEEMESDDESASGSENEERTDRAAQLQKLQRGLKDVPLATLLKAQHAVPEDDSEGSDGSDDDDGPAPESSSAPSAREQKLAQIKARLRDMQRAKGKALNVEDEVEAPAEREKRERHEEAERIRIKREAKHAPMAMSTKKQVSRKRQVIEMPKVDRRDPRFLSMSAGQVNPHLHSQSYAFLPGMLKKELNELRDALTVARKAEANAPVAVRAQRIAEREALDRDVARVRSKLERTERENRERETMAKLKKEERSKREAGKGEWYMKRSEQKEALLKARFDSLQKRGGKSAVKKAIEKKQKKVAGKEKKSRPFAPGQAEAVRGDGSNKRRKV